MAVAPGGRTSRIGTALVILGVLIVLGLIAVVVTSRVQEPSRRADRAVATDRTALARSGQGDVGARTVQAR